MADEPYNSDLDAKLDIEEENGEEKTATKLSAGRHKVIKTFCIVLIWICLGLWSEVTGATLQDLMYNTNSDYERISQAISMKGAGGIVGAVSGGYLIDRLHSKVELIIAMSIVACAALNAAIPFCRHVELLFAIYFTQGIVDLIINIGGPIVVMSIWKERASGPLHAIHIGYGIGSFIVPQLMKNFISEKLSQKPMTIVNAKCLQHTNSSQSINGSVDYNGAWNITMSSVPPQRTDTLQYGFIIISIISLVVSIIWFVYFFYDKNKMAENSREIIDKKTAKEIFNPNTCLPGHPMFVVFLYIFLFLWAYTVVGAERTFSKYLFSYLRLQVGFEIVEATQLLTAFWISATAGRFLAFVFAHFFPMKFILFVESFGNLASVLALFFFSCNRYVLWVCVCVSGMLIGPCFPSGIAFADRYMQVTATGVTVLAIGIGLSEFSILLVIGHLIEKFGISVLISIMLGFGITAALVFICILGLVCTRGEQVDNEETTTPEK